MIPTRLTQPGWTLPLGLAALAVGLTSLPRFADSEVPPLVAGLLLLAAAVAWYGTFEGRLLPEVLPKLRIGAVAVGVLMLSLFNGLLLSILPLAAGLYAFLHGLQLSVSAAAVLIVLATMIDLAQLARVRWVRWLSVFLTAGLVFTVAGRTFASHLEVVSGANAFVNSSAPTVLLSLGVSLLAFVAPIEWLLRLDVRKRLGSLAGMLAALVPLGAVISIGTPLQHQHVLVQFAGLGGVFSEVFVAILLVRALFSLPGASAYERKLRELDAVYDFGLAAGTAFDRKQLQSAVLDALLRVAEPDVALMVEPEPDGPGMSCVLLRAGGQGEQIYRYSARTPWEGLRDRFADRRPVVIVDHTKTTAASLAKVWEPSNGSSVVVPVITQDGKLHAVLIAGRFETHAFPETEVRSLAGFANQVALALDHARLLRDTVESERRKRELEIARDLQLNLLPKESPRVPGVDISAYSEPASEVGGDYYDYLELRNGNTAVVVGDVAGHGMPAGLLMAVAKSAIYTQSLSANPPTVLMERLTKTLLRMSADNQFMTLVFAELDLQRGRLLYSNAGHHYPLHYRAASGDIAELESTGVPLGLLPLPPGPFVERSLGPGDVLVLYSDGVVEAFNADDEMFGTDRLGEVLLAHRTLQAKTIVQEIFASVREFAGGEPLHDDATVVVVRILELPSETATDANAS